MQQIIDAGQCVLDPEFLLEDSLSILRPQGADAVGLGGIGQETCLEGVFVRRRQLGGPTCLSFREDRLQTVIPIRVDPSLHESSAATQDLCDRWRIVVIQSQENGSIAVSLLGITLLATSLTQMRQILRMVEIDLHLTVPPVFPRVWQMSDAGAILF
jgi:hypothetical protein